MFQDPVAIEEGTQLARQISISADEDQGRLSSGEPSRSRYDTIVVAVEYIIPFIWCAYQVSMGPLFLYGIAIDHERKCFTGSYSEMQQVLNWLSMVIDLVFMVSLLTGVGLVKKKEKIIWLVILLADLASGIWPYFSSKQFVVRLVLSTEREAGVRNFYSANIYLLFYFGAIISMYVTFARATRTSAKLAKATWTKAAFNLILYIYAGHAFGGLWYTCAVQKQIDCWGKACKKQNYSKCSWSDFFCRHGDNHYKYTKLDELCPTKTRDATIYDFGIYYDALQSGIVKGSISLPKKILYCLRWSLQNLSGFGQNLQVSTDAWENIFVISITVYGVVLFAFFIGNVQRYLQSETERLEMKRRNKLEIEQSKFFEKLPKNLQKKIKRYPPDKWEETNGVDFENLFNNLPQTLRKDIKRQLCSDILKTVEEFKCWSEELLNELCDCAKPVSYTEYTQIVQKDSSIDKILLVVDGTLKIYSFTSVHTGSTSTGSSSTDVSASTDFDSIARSNGERKFYGKELVNWFRNDPYSSNLPMSTKTIEAATKVNAFALMHYKLRKAFIKHQTARTSN